MLPNAAATSPTTNRAESASRLPFRFSRPCRSPRLPYSNTKYAPSRKRKLDTNRATPGWVILLRMAISRLMPLSYPSSSILVVDTTLTAYSGHSLRVRSRTICLAYLTVPKAPVPRVRPKTRSWNFKEGRRTGLSDICARAQLGMESLGSSFSLGGLRRSMYRWTAARPGPSPLSFVGSLSSPWDPPSSSTPASAVIWIFSVTAAPSLPACAMSPGRSPTSSPSSFSPTWPRPVPLGGGASGAPFALRLLEGMDKEDMAPLGPAPALGAFNLAPGRPAALAPAAIVDGFIAQGATPVTVTGGCCCFIASLPPALGGPPLPPPVIAVRGPGGALLPAVGFIAQGATPVTVSGG
mmetsp:Transcript_46454/g.140712  ORF Transcript_46454/g.140712 Transcript_46454/m.140712 type:complete len:352 (-) Transcript_46454:2734-3789(-)